MPPGADENRHPPESEREMLREQEVARLFQRASELDAARAAGSAIEELRATAAEAGISASAFDAALAEMRANSATPAPVVIEPSRRRRARRAGIMFAIIVAMSVVWVGRRVVPPVTTGPTSATIEEAILLNCLAAADAAGLVRPLLRGPDNTIVHHPNAPRVLTIRGTADQLEQVKSLLRQHDGAGSPACSVGPATR